MNGYPFSTVAATAAAVAFSSVAGHRCRNVARTSKPRAGLIKLFCRTPHEHHACAFFQVSFGGCLANTAGCSGHNRRFSIESIVIICLLILFMEDELKR